MKAIWAAFALMLLGAGLSYGASDKKPPPAGAFKGAPAEYTHFSAAELTRGFLSLAFGSDLRIGARQKGIRRFDRAIRTGIVASGSVDRAEAMQRVLDEFGRKIPNIEFAAAQGDQEPDLTVYLIDEKNFGAELEKAFGRATARAFIRKTSPQCMTNVSSQANGEIVRAISFVIVDQGDDVFLDCAYHELLHAFGLSNHDQSNPWTTLNQKRTVGYLTVYDRALLTLLYDPHLKTGMTADEVRRILPGLIDSLGVGRGAR